MTAPTRPPRPGEPKSGAGPSRARAVKSAIGLVVLVVLVVVAGHFGVGPLTAEPSGSMTPRIMSGASTPCPCGSVGPPTASSSVDAETGLRWVSLDDLPAEARRTVILIEKGGPYPYSKDGVGFGNRERVLPRQPSGYYHEYTVKTPGESDRGARRIVTGDDDRTFFWTADHYETFQRIRR